MWQVTHDRGHVTPDSWHLTPHTWHVTADTWHVTRAPENLKLAGNLPKMAAMCGHQDYKKKHIVVVFKIIIPINVVFMHIFWAFIPIWLAFTIWVPHFAGGHLFLKLFYLASQKWLPKSEIGWEHVPTVSIFLEPCMWHLTHDFFLSFFYNFFEDFLGQCYQLNRPRNSVSSICGTFVAKGRVQEKTSESASMLIPPTDPPSPLLWPP